MKDNFEYIKKTTVKQIRVSAINNPKNNHFKIFFI